MKLKKHRKIAIVMGSQSDFSTMKDCVKILKSLKISFDLKIVSADHQKDFMILQKNQRKVIQS